MLEAFVIFLLKYKYTATTAKIINVEKYSAIAYNIN